MGKGVTETICFIYSILYVYVWLLYDHGLRHKCQHVDVDTKIIYTGGFQNTQRLLHSAKNMGKLIVTVIGDKLV